MSLSSIHSKVQILVLGAVLFPTSVLPAADRAMGIYFLDDGRTLEDALSTPIEKLPLASEPWIGTGLMSGYDFSSHAILLGDGIQLREARPPLNGKPFVLVASGRRIYVGALWTPLSSQSPPGGVPIINTPSFHAPPDICLIELPRMIRHGKKEPPDPRNDPRLRKSLEAAGLLREGIALTLDKVEVMEARRALKYTYTIRNEEDSPLHVLDPEKTGAGLFQYFTGGVTLLAGGWKSIVATSPEEPRPPEKLDPAWLTVLKRGESIRRTVILSGFSPLMAGSYEASFTFRTPGLGLAEPAKPREGRIWQGQKEARLPIEVR